MNICSEFFTTDVTNFSDIYNYSVVKAGFPLMALNIIIILLCFPTNAYVIWLIVTGTGNGLAAEFFSLNLSVCEMLFCMQSFFYLISLRVENLYMPLKFLDGLALSGRPLFQCLICVERYLAVVHPVTFLKYKPLRYRVICSVTVWVASFVSGGISIMTVFFFQLYLYYIFIVAHLFLFLSIQLFCLVAVLRALKQSGPGERARERNEENHMKKRAFYMILITTATVLIIIFPCMISNIFSVLVHYDQTLMTISYFCFISAGLVQPLLFLCRVGKLPSIKCQ